MGFETYDDRFGNEGSSDRPSDRRADAVTSAALAWLETMPTRAPVFLWTHNWDPHDAYDPPEPFRSRFGDPYRGEIAYTDHEIGRLLEGLDRLGRRDDALVEVVADHGESFGEHGETYHGLFIYEPTIHVPAILSWPGRIPEGRTLDDETSLVDVAPTVLSLLGLERPAAMQGVDLGPAMRGEAKIARPQGPRSICLPRNKPAPRSVPIRCWN